MTIQMKATEQYLPVVLFIMPYSFFVCGIKIKNLKRNHPYRHDLFTPSSP